MDFTEIDPAGEFETELSALIKKYLNRSLSRPHIEEITYMVVEDMFDTEEYVDGE